jgi:hypothetical protein
LEKSVLEELPIPFLDKRLTQVHDEKLKKDNDYHWLACFENTSCSATPNSYHIDIINKTWNGKGWP